MTTTDPYGLADTRHQDPARPAVSRAAVARVLLWVLLVVSVAVNTVVSLAGAGVGLHLACGAVAGLCAAVLVVQRLRSRR
ncbi:hypothetical protein ACF09J_24810 [Streptomyces sp. NPDC014889]|uniref:hypothetical protein n=1 Tax=Streptomyces sp. NPDC014889 TaxID=3364928 RepID=UPI0036FB7888